MELQEEGYRFHPTDSELLTFLLRFIENKDLRDNGFITEHDVYKQEPWVTYGYGRHCGGEDDGDTSIFRYFISPRHKKEEDNVRFCRFVGEKLGSWKQQDKGKKVMSNQNNAVKKSLSYDSKKCCPDGGKWLMKEYTFCEAILRKFGNSEFRNYVICAIKRKSKKNSSSSRNVTTSSMDFSDEEKVISAVEPQMDQEYKAITPINSVEQMVQIQGEENDQVLGQTTTTSQIEESRIVALLENNGPEIRDMMLNEDYGMNSIPPPINVVENPVVEFDDVEMQIQEAAGEGNGVLEFEYAMPENNLPNEPAHLQEGCAFRVNEDHILAYRELQANDTSFVELLSGGGDSVMRNNQVQTQELELNTSQIQEPMIPDFANMKSNINMVEIYNNLAEFMGVNILMNPEFELITPFDSSKQAIVESNQHQLQTQEVAGEENGRLGLTAPFSQIQDTVMPENNVPAMFDMGDTLLEKNQTQCQLTPQEESETFCEIEESSLVVDLAEALLDHAPMKDRLDAIRESKSTLLLDQQSWQSKAHLQDMLL